MSVLNAERWRTEASHWRDILYRLRYAVKFHDRAKLLSRNRQLFRRHADTKRCFVIGNGPSLKTQDLKLLRDEFTIVTNSFFKHPDHAIVKPNYCCVGDVSFIEDQPHCIGWLREIDKKLPATTLFFLPQGRELFAKHHLFQNHEIYYIDRLFMVDKPEHVSIDISQPTNVGHSTGTSFAIPVALYLGFQEIYLIGFDANWIGIKDQSSVHFYDTNEYYPHFDKALVPGETLEDQLWTSHLEFKGHRLLRDKALLMGARIFNATNGGWLDMYPRVRYETLFEGCGVTR